jgi:hypothetical protein
MDKIPLLIFIVMSINAYLMHKNLKQLKQIEKLIEKNADQIKKFEKNIVNAVEEVR